MARIWTVLGSAALLAFATACSERLPPPSPASETPYPAERFPYPPGSRVVLEGRDQSGRLLHSQLDVWKDPFGERVVVCTIAHGAVANVRGFQYQPEEKRWYVFVKHQDCSGYVWEVYVRRADTDPIGGLRP